MCGVAGIVSSKIDLKLKKVLNDLFIASAVRGRHGSGMAVVDKESNITITKSIEVSAEFLDDETVIDLLKPNDNKVLATHCRHATHGELIEENCHPFIEDNTVLFHNGTLRKTKEVNWKQGEVDSLALTKYLSKAESLKEAANLLEKVSGAYALVWLNAKDSTINFARNDERPIFMAELIGITGFIYGSERLMLEWIADRNNLKTGDIVPLSVGKIFSVNFETFESTSTRFTPKNDFLDFYNVRNDKSPSKWTNKYKESNELSSLPYSTNDLLYLGKHVVVTRASNNGGWLLNDANKTLVTILKDSQIPQYITRVRAKIVSILGDTAEATFINSL